MFIFIYYIFTFICKIYGLIYVYCVNAFYFISWNESCLETIDTPIMSLKRLH